MLCTLDLTIYEVENAIIKGFKRNRIRDVKAVNNLFEEVFKVTQIIKIEPKISEAVDLASREGITLYDAYYLYIAQSMGIKLVTEDRDLRKYAESTM